MLGECTLCKKLVPLRVKVLKDPRYAVEYYPVIHDSPVFYPEIKDSPICLGSYRKVG